MSARLVECSDSELEPRNHSIFHYVVLCSKSDRELWEEFDGPTWRKHD